MISHGMMLLALAAIDDNKWSDVVAALQMVHLVRVGDGEDNFIAVVMNTRLYNHELCCGT